jgi:flagellin-specific chaperone FliS
LIIVTSDCKIVFKEKEGEKMKKVWKLYEIATEIIEKLCENKCYHLGDNIIHQCYDYIRQRLEKDDFQARVSKSHPI